MSAPHEAAAPVEEERQEDHAERARPSAVRRLGIQRYAILIVFAAMVAGFGAAIPSTFLSIGNLSNILGSQAVLFILVMAVLLPTVMGDFVDLSLGSSLGVSAMTLAVLNVQHGTNAILACLAGIAAALLVGLFNVFFVVYFDNDPFIVTLGTMTIVQASPTSSPGTTTSGSSRGTCRTGSSATTSCRFRWSSTTAWPSSLSSGTCSALRRSARKRS
jgi:ribose/xylose/arabinose/galactoside ABC-type transport system permease subunit